MDITKMLTDAVGSKIGEQFGFDNDKVGGIVETISGAVGGGGDSSSMLSGLGSMLGGGSDSSDDNIGSTIISALTSKNGLSDDIAGKIKDMALPLVMEFIKDKAGDKLGGMLGGLKF